MKIPNKESLETEFKSDFKCYPDRDLIEEIVGMTNTAGGNLYLGVEDDATVTGLHKKHKDTAGVIALIANNTVPPVIIDAEIVNIDNRDVMVITVPKSRGIISTSSGKMLRRRLKADGLPEVVPMFSYEIPSRLAELQMLDYSAQPLAGATIDDLDSNQRVRLRKIIQTRQGGEKNLLTLSDEELDIALRIITNVGDCYVPTVTGMLLLGKEDKISELLPGARSSFQVLEGTQVRMNEESSKPLLEVFENFETYLNAWNPEREMEYGLLRIPIPEFDRAAFREGLVNAFCHRDYTLLGVVRVMIDDEGMIISNPGGFIDGVNLKNLLTVEPHGRNPALADAMKRIGLAEKTGRGIDRIFEGSIMYGRPWPDYSESTSRTVKLFIGRAKADLKFVKILVDEQNRLGKPLSIYSLMILSLLNTERRLDMKQIVERTNLSENKTRLAIEKMIEQGLIEDIGKGKNRSFIMGGKIYSENRESAEYVRQAGIDEVRYPELIMKLADTQGGIITKRDVQDLLHIAPNHAYLLLKQLKEEGKIELLNGGKYSKYRKIDIN